MDPRQPPPPQHPFSRNAAASPFTRPSFPPTNANPATSQPPYPPAPSHPPSHGPHPHPPSHPASHPPPSTGPPYSEMHARKPSDPPPYYPGARQYGGPEPGPGPMPPSTHSRHPSTSSIASGPGMTRAMPPPSSPPQQQGQQQQGGPGAHQMGGPYGPPAPRPPPVQVGPPTAFPRGRELPALESLTRTGQPGSSMSISSMLANREPPQYAPGPPPNAPGPGPGYNQQPVHASPRMHQATAPEYAPFRRPQTPEHHRMYDGRDPRGPTAASPPAYNSTPEVQRYGTPGAYPPRGPPMPLNEQGRDPREPPRMQNAGVPPRPNSQPKSFQPVGPPRMEVTRPPNEMYGHREEQLRPAPAEEYNPERPIRVLKYEEQQRFMPDRERHERERQERERHEREIEFRERERRERAMSGGDPGRPPHGMHPQEYARQMEQRAQQPYGRPPEPREQGNHWPRPGYEAARAPYDPTMHHGPPRHQEYPPASGPHFNNGPHQYVERHPMPPHQNAIPPPGPVHPQSYDSPDRQRMNHMHMDRQPQQHQLPPRSREEQAVPPPSVAYGGVGGPPMYDSPRNRTMEELNAPHGPQRNLLGVQEINRKGRISPLPQAVQGAQPQLAGPAGEPGIKSEFGRMFSGIGSGVGAISSPVPTGAQLPFNAMGLLRREEPEGALHEPVVEIVKPGRGKRRKLKEEDIRDEDGSTGRSTPVGGRAKKAKTHAHHHHQYVPVPGLPGQSSNVSSHHHHHHHHGMDQTGSPATAANASFKHVKGSTPVPSPTSGLARELPNAHHHHHSAPRSVPAKAVPPPRSPSPVILPKPKQIISSKAVLESVASYQRVHLGDVIYKPRLQPARAQDPRTGRPPRTPFKSTMEPLPYDMIRDKYNCTLTVKIGKEHLSSEVREEITRTRALWGTEVYTDDSDVIAACIHGGWIRGEWHKDVNISLLNLDQGYSVSDVREETGRQAATNGHSSIPPPSNLTVLDAPPKTGPMAVPENRDLHVQLVILPRLEKYASTTRFGIKSREFGGALASADDGRPRINATHDGISYMITEIRWLTNGGESQNRLRGKARRERIRKALREIELTPSWAKATSNGSAPGSERQGPSSKASSEVDKENQPQRHAQKMEVEAPQKQEEPKEAANEQEGAETGSKTASERTVASAEGNGVAVTEKAPGAAEATEPQAEAAVAPVATPAPEPTV
ncbi:histone deacetylation protein Rxt3-domain-containing protein [Apiosordaria backusii]|uniref:Histone deacetylation protein Rxt3-domain-containing protein n=1 Tax=Apiosordaria backusii TaxID=314023 RepID=A0AA40EG96_9PEZI|nr:histone deacetylation protein Rxt3-domain-containing protein [Apiosordaria backusii]